MEFLGPGLVRDRGGQKGLGLMGKAGLEDTQPSALGQGGKCVSSFGRWLLASQACLPSRPQLPSPPCRLPLGLLCLFSKDYLKKERRNPQARCAEIDLLKEVNSDSGSE